MPPTGWVHCQAMHVLSEFLGTTFGVEYEESVEPHLVVVYWDWDGPELRAKYGLHSRKVFDGWLPYLGMDELGEWIDDYWAELLLGWEDCELGKTPNPVAPLV